MEEVRERGWASGLGNLISRENGRWVHTRQWLWNVLIWLGLVTGLVTMVIMESGGEVDFGVMMLGEFTASIVPAGIIIMLQNEVVKEKELGTAAWVLSSPVSREAFILAKILVNIPWVLGITVVLQWAASWLVFAAFYQPRVPAPVYIASMGINLLHAVFWITLTLMLGCFANGRGPVIGIAMILLFLQQFLGGLLMRVHPSLRLILPQALEEIPRAWLEGSQAETLTPVAVVSTWCVVFITAALWRIRREEF